MKYLLGIYYVPGPVPDTGTRVNETKNLVLNEHPSVNLYEFIP